MVTSVIAQTVSIFLHLHSRAKEAYEESNMFVSRVPPSATITPSPRRILANFFFRLAPRLGFLSFRSTLLVYNNICLLQAR